MEATIEVSGLRKRFGPAVALDGMSFTVQPGQVTGFVGPNGAGKSTTMRVILGLDAADEGTALVGGQPYASLRHPLSHVGALLDAAALQPSRSARNHLLWLAHSQGLGARRVDAVIEQAGLQSVVRRKAGGFSLGMRQRLGIAAAMLGDPPVLMMDEPFNGMDPEGIVWMRGFLRSLAGQGRAVLVSSHLMSELQDAADHLVVVGRGKVIADTSVHALLAAASRRPGHGAHVRPAGGDDGAGPRGGHRRRHRPRHADDLRAARGTDRGPARRERGAVLRGDRAPRQPGGGLHGADQGRGRVPAPAGRARRGSHVMTAQMITACRQARQGARDGLAQLLRAEWTKFRTVRGWVIGMVAAALVTVALGVLIAGGGSNTCQNSPTSPVLSGAACLPPRSAGAGRPGGHRPVLLRPPAPDRKRQHHRPGYPALTGLHRERKCGSRPGP